MAKAQELRIEEPKLPRKKLKPSRFFEKKEGSDTPETAKQQYEKMFIADLRRTLNAYKTVSIKMDLNTMKPCNKFLF